MKYPSVFLAVVAVWIVIVAVALSLDDLSIAFNLYIAAVIFTLLIFLIGFWRNK